MRYLFLFFISLNVFATPEQDMRQRLLKVSDPVWAAKVCGLRGKNPSAIFDDIAKKLDFAAESCLLSESVGFEKEKLLVDKYQKAKEIVMDEDCSKQDTQYLKALCTVIQGR